jgi:hypothetical protein
MISIVDTSLLENLLGDRFICLSSTSLTETPDSLKSLEMNMIVSGHRNEILFDCDYKIGFFENEEGDVFYDYKIKSASLLNRSLFKSKVTAETSEISQIDIYGRQFNAKDFISYPRLYKKVKSVSDTDDIFVLRCKNGETISLVFHPYFPSIEVFFKKSTLDDFFLEYKNIYHLHRTLK